MTRKPDGHTAAGLAAVMIHLVKLVAHDWVLGKHEYDIPTEISPDIGETKRPWADEQAVLAELAGSYFITPESTFTDNGILYVVPKDYAHCRRCGLHGVADWMAWVKPSVEENMCDDGTPDPHGAICPECQ